MKSKFFKSRSIGLSEQHIKTLAFISKLPDKVLTSIADYINNDYTIESRRIESYFINDRVEKINDLCSKCDFNEKDFFDIFYFTTYILRRVYQLDDTLSDLLEDFVSQNIITVENREKIHDFFKLVEAKCQKIAVNYLMSMHETASLPALDGFEYTVNLRLVTKNPYIPMESPIEDYQPNIEGLVLAAIIELTLSDGANKKVSSFQVNFSELEGLIVRLQACQKQMRLLQTIAENQPKKE